MSNEQKLEGCPHCGGTPSFSRWEWRDERRYIGMAPECCTVLSASIGWQRARDMPDKEKESALREILVREWNTRTPPLESYLVMGHGESDTPEFKFAKTREEAFDAMCGMMYDPPSEMPADERTSLLAHYNDADQWHMNGTRWDIKFEIGGIEITKIVT